MTKAAVVVLVAGKGTRFKSKLPKPLHPLAGRPMILHLLASVAALKPERAILVTAPDAPGLGEVVARAPIAVETVTQAKPLGTGDAVRAAREALAGYEGDVLVLYGDTPLIEPKTLARLLAARRGRSRPAVVVLGARPTEGEGYGRLVLAKDGGLEAIVEELDATPEEREAALCNAGPIVAGTRALFELLAAVGADNAKGEYYLTDVVALARRRGLRCAVVEADPEEALGVNSRVELALAEAVLQTRLRRQAMERGATLIDPATTYLSYDTVLDADVTVGPNVFFGPGVTVAGGAEIRGFCHIEGARIEEGAVIGPFARLRPGAEIGPEAHIGNFVEVKEARVEAGAKVNHMTYLGDARVGAGANVGAGTITCNYDGFKKSRTDIGANAFIGSNVALVAPVTIGDGAVIGAGSVIVGDVPADALAVARGQQRTVPGGAARFRARRREDEDAAKADRPKSAVKRG